MLELSSSRDWVKHAPPSLHIERIEAFFSAHAFDPHRHDTYAIGRTLAGVQSFSYRGASKHSHPGVTMVLHPDEMHDGHAGSESGFRYRMLYVPPALVQQVLKGSPLPFLKEGLSQDPRLAAVTNALLYTPDTKPDPLAEEDALYNLITVLAKVSGQRQTKTSHNFMAAARAREYIDDNLDRAITLDELACCTDRDKWSLSRDFRVYFGTSPHRYLTMRRLDRVRSQIHAGKTLIEASLDAGFFDQSHMTRHFKKTFGLSPSRWWRSLVHPGA